MSENKKHLESNTYNSHLSSVLPDYLEKGKLPPQAVDLEEAVLGAMMLEKAAVNETIDILHDKAFYKPAHNTIFKAIHNLFSRSEPIDVLTVTQELKKMGKLEEVGGAYYISQLTARVGSAANIEHHARIILQKYIQRELIRTSTEIIEYAYDDTTDIFELLDKAESSLFNITDRNIRKGFDSIPDLLKGAIEQIEEVSKKEDGVSGVPTGFRGLDKVTSGFQPSDMIILAARPGMGKTAFVLSLARNVAVEHKKAVAIFSLEMSSLQLVNRLIASETEISSEKLKKGDLAPHEWEQLHSKIQPLTDAKIFIDDTPALSVFELRAKCRRLKEQHDIELVIIDYLQLMTVKGDGKGNREQEISTISRSIKGIAKELNIPIIALSQLNRSVETRGGNKRPQLADLRESGAIEQDADMVMFIYRPEYYQIEEDEKGNLYPPGYAEVIIAKHRNGSLEDVPLKFIGHLTKFVNPDDDHEFLSDLSSNASDFMSESNQTITIGSKLNNDDFYSDENTDEAPF
ncbi:MAG: replicative DNA helicase [Bacteroidetes bacterium]|nr:MAG: replicative DNA helicase [Bacteroidota bacterium]